MNKGINLVVGCEAKELHACGPARVPFAKIVLGLGEIDVDIQPLRVLGESRLSDESPECGAGRLQIPRKVVLKGCFNVRRKRGYRFIFLCGRRF